MQPSDRFQISSLDLVAISFVLTAILVFWLGVTSLESNTEDVLQWLPDRSAARDDYDLFTEHFGGDDFLVATWRGCTVSDPRLAQVANLLRDDLSQGLVASVRTGPEVIEQLQSSSNLSPTEVRRRFRGVFFGQGNPQLTGLLIELSKKGTAHRHESMNLLHNALETVGIEKSEAGIGGYPYIATFIDRELKRSNIGLLIPSIFLATITSLLCLRDWTLTVIVFLTAVGAAAVSVAIVPLCGVKHGGLMSIIPALVFVLATSGSIHLIRYGLEAIGDVKALLSIGWRPCTISTLTTAIGMLSLLRSDFPAIRNFGLFCATGVGVALLFQLVFIPWLLWRFGQAGLHRLAARNQDSVLWENLATRIGHRRIFVTATCSGLIAMGALGLMRLTAEVEVERLFKPNSEIMVSLRELENQLGPMDQTELMVAFPDVNAEQFPDRVRFIRRLQAHVKQIKSVEVAFSLVNALPSEPSRHNVRGLMKRATYRTQLRKERDNLNNSNLLSLNGGDETWRISLRFPFSKDVDFEKLKQQVVDVAREVERNYQFESISHPQPTFTYTGKTHLFLHAQSNLLADLFRNFLLAFLIITPILIAVLRSVPLGMIAMIPNVFPTLLVFGTLGWMQYPVDLAIAMTACVALGIAVDDTTHFLVRYRDYGGSLDLIAEPIRQTIRQCGPAMLHTTLISAAGLSTFYFSELLVVSRFSWAIISLLAIALIADVVMLPAILFLFWKNREPNSKTTTVEIEKLPSL